MKNRTIAYYIFTSIAIAFLGAMLEDYDTAEVLYSISGLGYLIFGTWGAVRLYKSE